MSREKRIVSLIASATEIVCALGFQDHLVGRSHECDFPPGVEKLPKCTEPRLDIHASSGEIDRSVKTLLESAASIYRVDADLLRALQPDVIVTQSHCEVCAVSEKDVVQALAEWLQSRPRIVSLAPNRLEDVWAGVRELAEVLEVPEVGERKIRDWQLRMANLTNRAKELASPGVACLEWLDPLMAAGNWMPELVELAGGRNLFGQAGRHSPWMTWDDLQHQGPDVILALPCGFDLARTRLEMKALENRNGWNELKAVRTGRVYLADGNQYFNRPGPRLVESLEILAEILHPESFSFGHRGTGWDVGAPG